MSKGKDLRKYGIVPPKEPKKIEKGIVPQKPPKTKPKHSSKGKKQ